MKWERMDNGNIVNFNHVIQNQRYCINLQSHQSNPRPHPGTLKQMKKI